MNSGDRVRVKYRHTEVGRIIAVYREFVWVEWDTGALEVIHTFSLEAIT